MLNRKILGLAGIAALALATMFGARIASATTLSVGGVKQSQSVPIIMTLASGSTTTVTDSAGSTTDTCTSSEVKGKTEGSFTGASVGGAISTLTFTNCSHTTKVIAPGRLSVAWTSGTNGTVTSAGAEVTVQSTVFGISAICKTGTGTDLGSITGMPSGSATMHLDATKSVDCGTSSGKRPGRAPTRSQVPPDWGLRNSAAGGPALEIAITVTKILLI